MRRALIGTIAVALTGGLAWPAAQGPSLSATARVIVETKPGEFARDLSASDFEVAVDGRPASMESSSFVDVPASILLLVDASESMTWGSGAGGFAGGPMAPIMGHDRLRTRSAINSALVAHLPVGDRLRIGAFSGRQLLLSEQYALSKEDQRDNFKAVTAVTQQEKLELNEPSPIWDMVVTSAAVLAKEPEPRAIILVSDGEALGNRYGLDDAAKEAVAKRVAVFTLAQTPDQRLDAPNGEGVMRRLADQTGGLFRTDENGAFTIEVEKFLKHFVAAMHGSYTVRVAVPDAAPHAVAIGVRRPGLTVHAPAWVQATRP